MKVQYHPGVHPPVFIALNTTMAVVSLRVAAKMYAGLGMALHAALKQYGMGKCLKCGSLVNYPEGVRHPDPACDGVLCPLAP